MKLKPINAVFTAVLLIAPAAFAQESGQSQSGQSQQSTQTSPEQQNQGATSQQGQTGGQAGAEQQGQAAPGQTGGQTTQQPGQAGGGMAGGQQPGAQGAGAPTGVITGTVTSYTPGQSITIRESSGQTREIPLAANSSVSPNIKTGSHVKVTESTVNGQQMVRVEPMGGKHRAGAAGTSGAQALPRTASNTPLLGVFGLLSLAAAAGIRFANRKIA